jgi:hypothetical protein
MITAGLMSLAFMGFAGLDKYTVTMLDRTPRHGAGAHRPRERRWGFAAVVPRRRRPAGREDRRHPAADPVRPVRLSRLQALRQAIAKGEADINQCPPGGEEGIRKLADLLGREFKPLSKSTALKSPRPSRDRRAPASAARCASRPARWMPSSAPPSRCTRSSPPQCTGCELCLAALPGGLHRHGPISACNVSTLPRPIRPGVPLLTVSRSYRALVTLSGNVAARHATGKC